jgi:hypothetical protein
MAWQRCHVANALGMARRWETNSSRTRPWALRVDCAEIQGYLISKAMPPAASQPVARNVVLQEA